MNAPTPTHSTSPEGTAMTVITDRLAVLDGITLDHGPHRTFDEGHCAMEVVAWLAGEGHTYAPQCASRILSEFIVTLNDTWDDEPRQALKPYLPRMVGTRDDGQDEARSYLDLDWLVRTHTPAWLDLAGLTGEAQALRDLRRIVDTDAARAAGPMVREGAKKARAARDSAGATSWAAARESAWATAAAASWATSWAAAWVAAVGPVARAASWDAAYAVAASAAASGADARVAAYAALKPTVVALQASALDLLDTMIDPSAVQS